MAEIKRYPEVPGSKDRDKAQILFSCHPDDFDEWFEVIRDDICEAHEDSVIWYKDNMSEMPEEEKKDSFWDAMNLFVFLLSDNLLESSDLVELEVEYARKNKVPILPISVKQINLQPEELVFAAKANKKFNNATFVEKYSPRYNEKLKNFLSRNLVDPAMVEDIKDAFAAYIFLSYRKVDREYAIKLIRQTKSIEELWDVAIWFDDYLKPDEDFNVGIKDAIEKSDLFNLLVTPHLLDLNAKGEPNYVMAEEYPMAEKTFEKVILPAEMVAVEDKKSLEEKFHNIPECIKPEEDRYKEVLKEIILSKKKDDKKYPENRDYLIGLSYMLGIDCIKDYGKAVELIKPEAEKGNLEAIDKVESLYLAGFDFPLDTLAALRKIQTEKRKERFEAEGEASELRELCEYVARSYLIYAKNSDYDYRKEIKEMESYLEDFSRKGSQYRREYAAFYKKLSKTSEANSLNDFLYYSKKYTEQIMALEKEAGLSEEELEDMALHCYNIAAVCSEGMGYTEDILKENSGTENPDEKDKHKKELQEKADEFSKLALDYYEKIAMSSESDLYLNRFIFTAAEFIESSYRIKEYCREKALEGLNIKEKIFGLTKEDIRRREELINK